MEPRLEDIKACESLFDAFYDIGSTEEGGVTRLGYGPVEDAMHDMFRKLGVDLDCESMEDEVGNTYIMNSRASEYILIGSHLDSVVEGGRYDGVAGVISGLMILRWLKEDGIELPIRVAAFRCEESSNFGISTLGSGLITGEIYKQNVGALTSKDGETLASIFKKKGYQLHPQKIRGAKEYLELHIEQGKVLEESQTEIGVVQTIAGPRRFRITLRGLAEHSGATPMGMRSDAMCAASEIILETERIGNKESVYQSVATIGIVNNHPNVMNVIPGEVELGIDIRGVENGSLDRMERSILDAVSRICDKRGIHYLEERVSSFPPVDTSPMIQTGLEKAARKMRISCRRMPSGAGHDAMSFAGLCDTGMVFIPCSKGISHNRKEFASISDICKGARVMYEYLKGRM